MVQCRLVTAPSCGLKLDNEAVRVAVGLRLGLDLCVPHECHCGSSPEWMPMESTASCVRERLAKHPDITLLMT